MVKAREPSIAIKRLKMSVDVDFTINWVHITMETGTISHIGVFKVNRNLVKGIALQVVLRKKQLVLIKLDSLIWDPLVVNF